MNSPFVRCSIHVCTLALMCGCATTTQEPAAKKPKLDKPIWVTTASSGMLGPDDVFEIRVFGETELSGVYRVSADGLIDFPLIGRVEVQSISAARLRDEITERLRKYVKQPHVSIYVREFNSQKVYVFGKVQRPGTFRYEQGMNIVQAITMAGGFARLANPNGTYVTRMVEGREERIRVPVEDIGEGLSPNLSLAPGDIVYVPEALF